MNLPLPPPVEKKKSKRMILAIISALIIYILGIVTGMLLDFSGISQQIPIISNRNNSNDNTNTNNAPEPRDRSSHSSGQLPITVINNTIGFAPPMEMMQSFGGCYIDENGNARWDSSDESIIMSNVRSIELATPLGNLYATEVVSFFIKEDNSLWTLGYNLLNRVFDIVGDIGDEPFKIMDNVANVYNDRLGHYALTLDGELYRWGGGTLGGANIEATARNPEKILSDVIKYCGNEFAIKSDGSLWTWNEIFYFDGKEITEEPTKIMDDVADFKTYLSGGNMG
jgi:F0F1-type ATP synthase membrane subunit c/vacuolar-type H+-ATPase subunit K